MAKSERKIITEFIELYKQMTCLWDSTLVTYNNKEEREKAHEILLGKLKELQEDATIDSVRRRIENMRCSYRREHKKVLRSRLRGDEHKPLLWYYDCMTFLEDSMEWGNIDMEHNNIIYTADSSEENSIIEFRDLPKAKKQKRSVSTNIFLPEHNEDLIENQDEIQSFSNYGEETEAFGKTVGLQLKELDTVQRVFAEKLISDVIFYGRLNRLSLLSNLVIGNENE